jgi:hypothetical protein
MESERTSVPLLLLLLLLTHILAAVADTQPKPNYCPDRNVRATTY